MRVKTRSKESQVKTETRAKLSPDQYGHITPKGALKNKLWASIDLVGLFALCFCHLKGLKNLNNENAQVASTRQGYK